MGAFFSNVQVRLAGVLAGEVPERSGRFARESDRTSQGEPTQWRADVVAAIRGSAEGEFDEVDADGKPDRTVFVLPVDEHGWTAIYDQAEEPEELAADLSKALGTHAVAVTVHDSDLLLLSLYSKGERIDRYDSNPGYYRERVSEKKRAELRGDPAAWTPLLIDGDADALAEALASKAPIVERKLRKVAALVGWEHANTGYRYASAEGEVLPEGTTVLRFRLRVRPAYETPKAGRPSFLVDAHTGHQKELPFAVGTSMTLEVGFRNEGPAGTGLSVLVWGSALEQGLVSVESFGVVADGERRTPLEPTVRASALGGRVLVAEVADLGFGAGSDGGLSGHPSPDAVRALTDVLHRARVSVTLEGRVLKEGRGELFLGLLPDENDSGSDAHGFRLSIAPSIGAMLEAPRAGRATKKLES